MYMDSVSRINEKEHYLVSSNGVTKSYGVGMGDSGGYATVNNVLLTKDEALDVMARENNVRIFAIREIVLDDVNEYKLYLQLQRKYNKE